MTKIPMTFRAAIRSALDEELARDNKVLLLGEDVGAAGGVFKVTEGLHKKYGDSRIIDTPISENGMAGVALGLAIGGYRPVLEIMFSDFLPTAMDQIVNEIAKQRYVTGGEYCVPLTIRNACGAAVGWAAYHSQCLESLLMNVPGLRIAVPSNAEDAYGLLKSAIRDNNPTIFCEHKRLYGETADVEQGSTIPFGKARIVREGKDVTVVSTMYMTKVASQAAEELAKKGIEVELIDLRTLKPLDKQTILDSISKTGRLVVVEEDSRTGGWGAEIASLAAEHAIYSIKSPVSRVCIEDVPIPFSPKLEEVVVPNAARVVDTIDKMMEA
jgi:acetoin:2,6-dichlorophenolindophenol oxidoreductase subunit beta